MPLLCSLEAHSAPSSTPLLTCTVIIYVLMYLFSHQAQLCEGRRLFQPPHACRAQGQLFPTFNPCPFEVSCPTFHLQVVAVGPRLASVSRKGHQAQDFLFNFLGKKGSLVNWTWHWKDIKLQPSCTFRSSPMWEWKPREGNLTASLLLLDPVIISC